MSKYDLYLNEEDGIKKIQLNSDSVKQASAWWDGPSTTAEAIHTEVPDAAPGDYYLSKTNNSFWKRLNASPWWELRGTLVPQEVTIITQSEYADLLLNDEVQPNKLYYITGTSDNELHLEQIQASQIIYVTTEQSTDNVQNIITQLSVQIEQLNNKIDNITVPQQTILDSLGITAEQLTSLQQLLQTFSVSGNTVTSSKMINSPNGFNVT